MTEQSNHTREQIIVAAMELFAEKGYYDTSMAAIAERAGVAKGTLYWYFQSKDELFKQMITEKGEKLFKEIHTVVNQSFVPTEALHELIRIKFTFAAQETDLSKILLRSVQFTDQEFKAKLFQQHKEMINEVQTIIQRGIDTGVFQQGSAQYMAVATIGMINGMASTFLCTQRDIQLDEMVELLYNMVLHGIGC